MNLTSLELKNQKLGKWLYSNLHLATIIMLLLTLILFGFFINKHFFNASVANMVYSQTDLVVPSGWKVYIGKNSHIPSDVSANLADANNPSHPSYKKFKITTDTRGATIESSGIIERATIDVERGGTIFIRSRVVLKAANLSINGTIDASGQNHANFPSDTDNPDAVGTIGVQPYYFGFGGSGGGYAEGVSSGGSNGGYGGFWEADSNYGDGIGAFSDTALKEYFSDNQGNLLTGGNGASGSTDLGSASGGEGIDAIGGGGGAAVGSSETGFADGGGGGYAIALNTDCSGCSMGLAGSIIRANGATGSLHPNNYFGGGGGGGVIAIKTYGNADGGQPAVLEAEPGLSLNLGANTAITSSATRGSVYYPSLFKNVSYDAINSDLTANLNPTDPIVQNISDGGELIIPQNQKFYIGPLETLPLGTSSSNAILINTADPGYILPGDTIRLKKIALGKNAQLVIRTRAVLKTEKLYLGDGATIDASGQTHWLYYQTHYNPIAAGAAGAAKYGFGGSGGAMANTFANGASAGDNSSPIPNTFGHGANKFIDENAPLAKYFKDSLGNLMYGGSGGSGYSGVSTVGNGGSGGIGVGGGGGATIYDSPTFADGGGGGYGISIDALELNISGKPKIIATGATGSNQKAPNFFSAGGGGGVIKISSLSTIVDINSPFSGLQYSVSFGNSMVKGTAGITSYPTLGSILIYPALISQTSSLNIRTEAILSNPETTFQIMPGHVVMFRIFISGQNLPLDQTVIAEIYFNKEAIAKDAEGNPMIYDNPSGILDWTNGRMFWDINSTAINNSETQIEIDVTLADFAQNPGICDSSTLIKNQIYLDNGTGYEGSILKNFGILSFPVLCNTISGDIYSGGNVDLKDLSMDGASVVTSSGTITVNGTSNKFSSNKLNWNSTDYIKKIINTLRQTAVTENGFENITLWNMESSTTIGGSTSSITNKGKIWSLSDNFTGALSNYLTLSPTKGKFSYQNKGVVIVNKKSNITSETTIARMDLQIGTDFKKANSTAKTGFIVPNGDINIAPGSGTNTIEGAFIAPQGTIRIFLPAAMTLSINGIIIADKIEITLPSSSRLILKYDPVLATKPLPLFDEPLRYIQYNDQL